MDDVNYFKNLFESIPDYIRRVLIMFSIKIDIDLLRESGF